MIVFLHSGQNDPSIYVVIQSVTVMTSLNLIATVDGRWKTEHNPRVPAALAKPVEWMLGSNSGARASIVFAFEKLAACIITLLCVHDV